MYLHFHSGIKLVAQELHKQPGKLELYSPSVFSSCLLLLWQRNPVFSPNPHSFHLNFYINITKPMTVTADGLCKNVLAFLVVNVAWLARNGDFCHFVLILHQISTRVHGHIQHTGRCKGRSYSFTGSAQFCSVPNIHTHFLFPLMNMQPKKRSTLFPCVVLVQGKAQILKGNAGPDF